MKLNVLCIYWFLLSVSIVSSCLLFLLVASEAENGQTFPGIKKENLQHVPKSEINISESHQEEPAVVQTTSSKGADLKSSFEEVSQDLKPAEPPLPGYVNIEEHLSQNSGISESHSDTNGAVYTLVDTATVELQQRATNILSIEPSISDNNSKNNNTITTDSATVELINAKEKDLTETKVENKTTTANLKDDLNLINKTNVTSSKEKIDERKIKNDTLNLVDDKQKLNISEDIPSFSEWTQKQLLEEAEKKKEKVNVSVNHSQGVNNMKLRSKNYASPDCGAKIISANPEAVSPWSVLSPSRDEYKLNTCTSRIWFIVELCEAIQAKKIDLANFELFSSSPKDFSVSVSDRFPSREWSSVGQFTAKDERDIQSFNLHPHLFGKFIKVEMLSHYGSEHYCPISLFRVYGTSEFEVLETEDQVQNLTEDDDDEDTLDAYGVDVTNNLFGSARDAVMSIVKKAAEVLVKGADKNNTDKEQTVLLLNSTPSINICVTPSHVITCKNCSDIFFETVYELLSCKNEFLELLLNINLVNDTLYNTDTCTVYGLDFISKSPFNFTVRATRCIRTFLAPKYLAALCNLLAVIESKVVLNVTKNQYSNASSANVISDDLVNLEAKNIKPTSLCPKESTTEIKTCPESITEHPPSQSDMSASFLDINPTRTISVDAEKNQDSSLLDSIPETATQVIESSDNLQASTTVETSRKNATEDSKLVEAPTTVNIVSEVAENSENFDIPNDQLDKLLSELNLDADAASSNSPATVAPPSNTPQIKESVFIRLSSRIKFLERNMSLSSQYLEELSRRYKKQVDQVALINEELKKREENEKILQEQVRRLEEKIDMLLAEKEGIWIKASYYGPFVIVVFVFCMLYICTKPSEHEKYTEESSKQKSVIMKRRKSIDTIGHETPVVKRSRRPSEEALKITGTYESLMIQEGENWPLSRAEKRRRKKKNALLRSLSIVERDEKKDEPMRRASSSDVNNRYFRQGSAPAQIVTVNGDIKPPVAKIQDIPFALEESEHTTVEPLELFTNAASTKSNSVNHNSKNGSVKIAEIKSQPAFMKTALSTRSKRSSTKLQLFKTDVSSTKVNGNDSSQHRASPDSSVNSTNGFSNFSEDDQSSVSSLNIKKEKKYSGFRKIFKKVFE